MTTRRTFTSMIAAAPLAMALGATPVLAQDGAQVTEMVMGDENAAVEVIEYASFTCPHCMRFHEGPLKELKANYIDTGKIKFVYREVYFDKYGMWASLVARCGGPEKFFQITDVIYQQQGEWARAGSDGAIADALRKIGLLAGIDKAELDACMTDGDQLRALVEWYQANAAEHGIQSTPSFVIDGRTYSNMTYAEFAEILDGKLGG